MKEAAEETVAERIEWAMKERGLKKNHVEVAADVSAGYLSTAFTRKANDIKAPTLAKLAAALQVDLAWLTDGKGPRPQLRKLTTEEIKELKKRKLRVVDDGSPKAPATEPTPHTPPVKSDVRRVASHWTTTELEGWIGRALQQPDHPFYSGPVIECSKVLARDRTAKMSPEDIVDFCAAALAAAHQLELQGLLGEADDEATKSDILHEMIKPRKVPLREGKATSAAELTKRAQANLTARGHEPHPEAVARREAADKRASERKKRLDGGEG